MNAIAELPEVVTRDGVDHINIDLRGQTELGRDLCHIAAIGFRHPVFGPFGSVEAYWAWLRYPFPQDRERFRFLHGMKAKKASNYQGGRKIKDFRALIIEATYLKIVQHEHIYEMFVNSDLPFDHYYIEISKTVPVIGVQVRPQISGWLVSGLTELRTQLKNGIAPKTPNYEGVLFD